VIHLAINNYFEKVRIGGWFRRPQTTGLNASSVRPCANKTNLAQCLAKKVAEISIASVAQTCADVDG